MNKRETPTVEEVYFAGLLEGDGCIYANRRNGSKHLTVQLRMTDKEVVSAFAFWANEQFPPQTSREKLLNVLRTKPANERCKEQFAVSVSGARADSLVKRLYPLWFSRRKAQVLASLKRRSTLERADTAIDKNRVLSWLAGFLDAEGCFRTYTRANGRVYVRFQLGTTDKDVIDFVASWINCNFPAQETVRGGGIEKRVVVQGPYSACGGIKPVFRIALHGRRALCFMKELRPLMRCCSKVQDIDKSLEACNDD